MTYLSNDAAASVVLGIFPTIEDEEDFLLNEPLFSIWLLHSDMTRRTGVSFLPSFLYFTYLDENTCNTEDTYRKKALF